MLETPSIWYSFRFRNQNTPNLWSTPTHYTSVLSTGTDLSDIDEDNDDIEDILVETMGGATSQGQCDYIGAEGLGNVFFHPTTYMTKSHHTSTQQGGVAQLGTASFNDTIDRFMICVDLDLMVIHLT